MVVGAWVWDGRDRGRARFLEIVQKTTCAIVLCLNCLAVERSGTSRFSGVLGKSGILLGS